MNIHDLQRDFVAYAMSIGVDKIGFTTAAPFTELKTDCVASRSLAISLDLKKVIFKTYRTPSITR